MITNASGLMPRLEKPVSRIFLGTAMDAFFDDRAEDLLDGMYDLGINAFDTARIYGNSEKSLGKWIAHRGVREEVVILSKCGHPDSQNNSRINPAAILEEFQISSEQLGTGYLDIYVLHRDDLAMRVEPLIDTFNELFDAGKVRVFGVSNWSHERLQQANAYALRQGLIPFSVSSPHYSLAEQFDDPWGGGCVSLSGPSNQSARDWYRTMQMPIVAYSSLGRGLFSGRVKSNDPDSILASMDEYALKGYGYPANFERLKRTEILAREKGVSVSQLALAFVFNQGMNVYAVIGSSNIGRMKSNLDALKIRLTPQESAYLDLQAEFSRL